MDATTDAETASFELSLDRLRGLLDAPLANLRLSGWWIRKTFFTRPRSKTDWILVELSKPEIRELFGRSYFEPGWETSFHFRREIINYRRVEYDAGRHSGIDWWQVHIRGYPHHPGAGEAATEIELTAHYEPEPIEHPDAHIRLERIDIDRGMESMMAILDEGGIDYEYVEVEAEDGE